MANWQDRLDEIETETDNNDKEIHPSPIPCKNCGCPSANSPCPRCGRYKW